MKVYPVICLLCLCVSTVLAGLILTNNKSPDVIYNGQNHLEKIQALERHLADEKKQNEKLKKDLNRIKTLKIQKNPESEIPVSIPQNIEMASIAPHDQELLGLTKSEIDKQLKKRNKFILSRLNLSPEETESFLNLEKRKMIATLSHNALIKNAITDEEKDLLRQKRDDEKFQFENEVAEVLGDRYSEFETIQKLKNEYKLLNSLSGSDENVLNDLQKDQLAQSFYDYTQNFDFSKPEVLDNPKLVKELNEEDKKSLKQELELRDIHLLEIAADQLTDEQLKALEKQQQKMRQEFILGKKKSIPGLNDKKGKKKFQDNVRLGK